MNKLNRGYGSPGGVFDQYAKEKLRGHEIEKQDDVIETTIAKINEAISRNQVISFEKNNLKTESHINIKKEGKEIATIVFEKERLKFDQKGKSLRIFVYEKPEKFFEVLTKIL